MVSLIYINKIDMDASLEMEPLIKECGISTSIDTDVVV